MKKILINAKYPEEKRVAIVEGDRLVDFYVETTTKEHLKGNIYKGRIARIEPSLQAVFVDFGPKRHGFLQLKDIMPQYRGGKGKRAKMHEVFSKGQELLVQVEKDERDTKGAALTTYISLPGRYLVMMPGQERVGVSRKIEDQKERERLKSIMGTLKLPKETGFILRTAGVDKTTEEISNDLKYLSRLWSKIKKDAESATAPALIYKEQDIVVRTVRDYLTDDVSEILVDDQDAVKKIRAYLRQTLSWKKINIKYYRSKKPIFFEHSIEEQISKLNERYVHLPSRGYLVFDRTEALTAIDVNSGRSRKEKNIEQTALRTNLEAAEEIARQLRLRDIGGLIVIDFIDMESPRHRKEVEAKLKSALSTDKAHTDIGGISQFGLLEMTRERLRSAYFESAYKECPECSGDGLIRTPESLALSAFRDIQMRVAKGGLGSIACRLPVKSANHLFNTKRNELLGMEKDFGVKIHIISDRDIAEGQYAIESEGISPPKR